MKPHSRILSLLTVVLTATLMIGACSDDNGTDPVNNGPSINMNLVKGDYFDSNRWMLDKNNQKVGTPEKFRITYKDNKVNNHAVLIDGIDDYVFLKEEDITLNVKISDDVAFRTDQSSNLYIYGFEHRLYNFFFDLIKQLDSTVVVPERVKNGFKQWDLVADFNSSAGNARPKGHTWKISEEGMEPFKFSVKVAGFPVAVDLLPEITGVYDGVVASMNIKNADVTRWQVRILVTMKLRSQLLNKDIALNQTFTYSDNPSGQITMIRESAVIDLNDISMGEYILPGEQREMYNYVKF